MLKMGKYSSYFPKEDYRCRLLLPFSLKLPPGLFGSICHKGKAKHKAKGWKGFAQEKF
jgi:hypothetical protein